MADIWFEKPTAPVASELHNLPCYCCRNSCTGKSLPAGKQAVIMRIHSVEALCATSALGGEAGGGGSHLEL